MKLKPPKKKNFWKQSQAINLIIPFFLLISCQEAEFPKQKCRVKSVDGPLDDLSGKWKLAGIRSLNMQTGKVNKVDFSCDDILYYFQEDASLRIESNVDEAVYPSGDYEFGLTLSPFHETLDGFTLEIGKTSWPCYIYSDRMTLDSSPTDGPTLYFVRIK
ncbi:hypothetical protein J2X69_001218 [Algoriphagus sp. 4150]|uniref:hypothetical protein n=1 Tax=Algoriphagus sp. 4150 TaxID=2817756 RepID=UPI00285C2FEF|nr:hypothetical protein [Algoriphagus sp. 4150]MDR7128886.1 hypothetical protein [Algoriphagus sp. 4150]